MPGDRTAKAKESVDGYVKALTSPYRKIVESLRKLMGETAAGLRETINPWGNPVWVGKGEVLWLIAYRDHVDFGFCRGTDLKDPKGFLEGTGERFRHVKIYDLEGIRPADLKPLIRQAIVLDSKCVFSKFP